MGGMKNVRQSINSTLDRIPVVNVLKRFIERVTPVQVKTQFKKLEAYRKERVEVLPIFISLQNFSFIVFEIVFFF